MLLRPHISILYPKSKVYLVGAFSDNCKKLHSASVAFRRILLADRRRSIVAKLGVFPITVILQSYSSPCVSIQCDLACQPVQNPGGWRRRSILLIRESRHYRLVVYTWPISNQPVSLSGPGQVISCGHLPDRPSHCIFTSTRLLLLRKNLTIVGTLLMSVFTVAQS